MRWMFIGIVILNVAFLAWGALGQSGAQADQAPVAATEFPAPLVLLEEQIASGEVPAPALAGPQSAVAEPGCPAIGPVPAADAAAVVAALEAEGFAAAPVSTEVAPTVVFWVHIPPAQSREAALRALRELHSRGVDSFVVASGVDANAISLGSFQSRDSALGVQERLAAVGYQTRIREQPKGGGAVWVVLADPAAQGFTERVRFPGKTFIKRLPCAGSR